MQGGELNHENQSSKSGPVAQGTLLMVRCISGMLTNGLHPGRALKSESIQYSEVSLWLKCESNLPCIHVSLDTFHVGASADDGRSRSVGKRASR